jgi:hypothetical protein
MTSQPIIVTSCASEIEAAIIQASLAAAGIRSVLMRDDAGGWVPSLSYVHGIGVAVWPEDLDAAKEQLDLPR